MRLKTVEVDVSVQAVARRRPGEDPQIEFVTAGADTWLTCASGPDDFAYVGCRPGEYLRLDDLLAPGAHLVFPGADCGTMELMATDLEERWIGES
ncbi:hypothetical protein ACFCXF_27680 [Streptomyces virginiae]|uniref:hypothetical protein n=1 Tax=Streptomyces virginiae TaxID=1961 RepID=UPI0035E2A0D3